MPSIRGILRSVATTAILSPCKNLQGLQTVRGRDHVVALLFQHGLEDQPHVQLVVHDEDLCRLHPGAVLSLPVCGASGGRTIPRIGSFCQVPHHRPVVDRRGTPAREVQS